MSTPWIYYVAFGTLALFWGKSRYFKTHPPLPPGPPAEPVIGHLRKMPSSDEDVFFYELGKKYGGVSSLQVLGQTFVILNTVEAAIDLLDKRGSIYSDRPRFTLCEVIGFEQALVFLGYGKDFQLHRRMLQKYFSKDKVVTHRPIGAREARVLAQNLLSNPEGRDLFFMRFATAIIIEISYGHQITTDDDPYLKIADDVCNIAVPTLSPPEASPIDLFPFLKHFPTWFPGTYYANRAREAGPYVRRLYDHPFADVTKQLAKGTAKPSFLATQMEELRNGELDSEITIEHIKGASAILYVAGAETTSSTLSIFMFAMLLHPECQIKAQEEIDRVVGTDRLPDFGDRASLPYVECLLQETHRWHPTVPLGVPHRTIEDDVYNGMFIPKGSFVIANARGMTLDENTYTDPFSFNPERFLPKPVGLGEPHSISSFGFGRRICPGRHLADDSLWIAVATILATLSIKKAIGEDGKEITPKEEFTLAITSHPRPYKCRIQPRNGSAQGLLSQWL